MATQIEQPACGARAAPEFNLARGSINPEEGSGGVRGLQAPKRGYRTDLTAERLREVIEYNPETGEFRWKKTLGSRAQSGKIAGSLDHQGYRIIRVNGTTYQAHRLVFLWMTGCWPAADIDHIDGNKANNRWENLREATPSQNVANSRRNRKNKSGFKGVHAQHGKWVASITVNGRCIYLGYFDTPEEAHAAYCKAALKHHAEFANDGGSGSLHASRRRRVP
jgi:HNH endonuclease/AP2 domain